MTHLIVEPIPVFDPFFAYPYTAENFGYVKLGVANLRSPRVALAVTQA